MGSGEKRTRRCLRFPDAHRLSPYRRDPRDHDALGRREPSAHLPSRIACFGHDSVLELHIAWRYLIGKSVERLHWKTASNQTEIVHVRAERMGGARHAQ